MINSQKRDAIVEKGCDYCFVCEIGNAIYSLISPCSSPPPFKSTPVFIISIQFYQAYIHPISNVTKLCPGCLKARKNRLDNICLELVHNEERCIH